LTCIVIENAKLNDQKEVYISGGFKIDLEKWEEIDLIDENKVRKIKRA